MHKFYKAIDDLKKEKYEEVARAFCELYEIKSAKDIAKAVDEIKISYDLDMLYEKSIKYFENEINKFQNDLDINNFYAGVISTVINNNIDNKYFDKVFKSSKNIKILLKLSLIYIKYGNKNMACKCINKCYQLLVK